MNKKYSLISKKSNCALTLCMGHNQGNTKQIIHVSLCTHQNNKKLTACPIMYVLFAAMLISFIKEAGIILLDA